MMDHSHPRATLILCLAALLVTTLVLTWPLPLHLESHLTGNLSHPGLQGDVFFQWNLQRQMEEGYLNHLWTPYVRHPVGQEFRAKVAFSLHFALYVLFMTAFDMVTAHNLTVLLVLFLNAAAAWLLLRERVGNALFALGGAFVFAFGPFVFLKADQGFVQKIVLFHLPLFVLFFMRVLEQQRRRDAAMCGLFLVLSLLVYPPFAVFNLVLAATLFGATLVARPRPRLRELVPPLAVMALLVIPFFVLVWWVGRADFVHVRNMPMDLAKFRSQGGYLDLFHPFRWFPYLGTFGNRPPSAYVEQLPLGLPVVPLLLALCGVAGRRRYALWLVLLAVVLAAIMAGPYLMRSGELVMAGGQAVPLPMYWLAELPLSNVLRMPIRLHPWLLMALLLAAGEGFQWLRTALAGRPRLARAGAALPLLTAALLVAEPRILFPEYGRFEVEELRRPDYCQEGWGEPGVAALHLPYFAPGIHEYQFQAVLCDAAIVNPVKRHPPPFDIPTPDAEPAEKDRFLRVLSGNRVRWVVVHPGYYSFLLDHPKAYEPSLDAQSGRFQGTDVERWLTEHLGPPTEFLAEDVRVYRIPPQPE